MNKNYFADSQRTHGSTDSLGRGNSQFQYTYTLSKPIKGGLNQVQEETTPPHKLTERTDKNSNPSPPIEDSQNISPLRSNLVTYYSSLTSQKFRKRLVNLHKEVPEAHSQMLNFHSNQVL